MKATFSWKKNTLFHTQFSPQNAWNRILGFWNFKAFWGSMPPEPLEVRIKTPCWDSQVFYSNLLATSIIIEIPVAPLVVQVENPFHQT